MRVTQYTLYNNNLYYQQNTLNSLNKVQTQIATGLKINTPDEDPTIFTKYLKLNEEENSLNQVKSSATFAQTFAQNTDTTLNDFVTTLGSFKTKLLNAANSTNDDTSMEAIRSELEGLLNHLKDLANTSIDGKYLFSGSKFDTKPIDDNFEYQGNDQKVKAFLGANVERAYNIDGASLFLGRDSDYVKHIGVNVVQYDKMKANPEFVVRGDDGKLYIDKHLKEHGKEADSDDNPVNEPITTDSEIRMLTGVEDVYDPATDTYSDGTSYFYITGRKPNGEVFNSKFSLSNSDSVNELLTKIGELYGNSPTSKVVDVSLNSEGQIQIKDINGNNLTTDFFMVASDSDEASVLDLVKNGDYIVSFNESKFDSIRNIDTITANNAYFDNRIFNFGSNFKLIDNSRDALPSDLLQDVIGSEAVSVDGSIETIDHLTLSGTDIDGNSVTYDFAVTNTTTMQDLLDSIKTNFGVDAKLENGEIVLTDNSIEKTESSKFSLSISAKDVNNNLLNAFRSKDVVNFDQLSLNKSGNTLQGNVSQVIKDLKTYIKDGETITIKNDKAQEIATDDTSLIDVMGDETLPKTFDIKFRDQNGVLQQAQIVLQDEVDANGHKSYFWIDTNRDGVKDNNEIYDIYEANGNLTPAHDTITTTQTIDPLTCEVCTTTNTDRGLTYRQFSDVLAMITSGNLPATNSFEDYQAALKSAKEVIDSGLDRDGRLYIKDKNNNETNLEVSIYDSNHSLSFQANNAITIDSAKVDFFETLQQAIDAVANKNNYPDSNSSNPRNFGIQGAIEAIDHVTDHIRRAHATIGAVGNEFQMSIERTEMLIVNVQTLQSDNIDTDIAEASLNLTSLTTSYQALLSSIAKVSNLTLLNYLR